MAKHRQDLYERELSRYRETIRLDHEVASDRYGLTLMYSVNPAERATLLREMGVELKLAADHYNIGVAEAREGNWNEAIASFKRAIETDATLADAYHNLALCYEKSAMLPQARTTWQAFLGLAATPEDRAKAQARIAELK